MNEVSGPMRISTMVLLAIGWLTVATASDRTRSFNVAIPLRRP